MKYPEKVERRPDRIVAVIYPEKVGFHPDRILDVRYPEKVAPAERNSYPGGMSCDSSLGKKGRIPYSLHSGFAYGKGLQSFGSSCF